MIHPQPRDPAANDERAASTVALRVIPAATLVSRPWKNGAGVTRQIAVDPPAADFNDFVWRLSTADVTASGPFSDWAGVDRLLIVLQGGAVRLTDPVTGCVVELARAQCLAFPGERTYHCELLGGPVKDLNLMLRRGQVLGGLSVRHGTFTEAITHRHTLFHCMRSGYRIAVGPDRSCALQVGDTVHVIAPADPRALVADITCFSSTPDACLVEAWIDPAASAK